MRLSSLFTSDHHVFLKDKVPMAGILKTVLPFLVISILFILLWSQTLFRNTVHSSAVPSPSVIGETARPEILICAYQHCASISEGEKSN